MEFIRKYFPGLDRDQYRDFEALEGLYGTWNSRINVISRKDIAHLYLRHVLHSLSIGVTGLLDRADTILDAGTGGGFPGIPLAILYRHKSFTLLDSVQKKITVTEAIAKELGLQNVRTVRSRVEEHTDRYDAVVCRAVARIPRLAGWTAKNLSEDATGILFLKGGKLDSELAGLETSVRIYRLEDYFSEEYFGEKKIVFLPAGNIMPRSGRGMSGQI